MAGIVLFSGGLDSTALLAQLVAANLSPTPLMINYGQRHIAELHAARRIVSYFGVTSIELNLHDLGRNLPNSSLTDSRVDVGLGPYSEKTIATTVVQGRNGIFLSIAVAIAASLELDYYAIAVHSGDHPVYPDCREKFVFDMARALESGIVGTPPKLLAPFLRISKTQIVRLGALNNAPFHLSWSCYRGGEKHCGKCSTCLERKSAFLEASVADPTEYEED